MSQAIYESIYQHPTIDGTNYIAAAGTTDLTSEAIDVSNCDEVVILLLLGVMAASSTVDLKVQECDTSGGSYADLAGTAATQAVATDDDKVIGITIRSPLKQFIKTVLTRGDGGNSTIQGMIVIKRYMRKQGASLQSVAAGQFVAQPEAFVSPVAGTA